MKRLLHIIPSLSAYGDARQLALLARGLPGAEFQSQVLSFDARDAQPTGLAAELRAAGVAVTAIRRSRGLDLSALIAGYRAIRGARFDLVHTWGDRQSLGRLLAVVAGATPIVATMRHPRGGCGWLQTSIRRSLDRRSAKLVVRSPWQEASYLAAGLPEAGVTVIRDAVQPVGTTDSDRQRWLAELGLPPEAKVMAYVGRLELGRRIKDLLWTTDQLHHVRSDAHLLVIGDGSQRANLERYAALYRIADRVHFLGWRCDAPAVLRHCDLFCSAAAEPCASSAILEAMAAGVGVVAGDTPVHREWIAPGKTGWLVQTGFRGRWAKTIHPLLNNRPLVQRIAANARQFVAERFSVEAMLAGYAAVYRELLG